MKLPQRLAQEKLEALTRGSQFYQVSYESKMVELPVLSSIEAKRVEEAIDQMCNVESEVSPECFRAPWEFKAATVIAGGVLLFFQRAVCKPAK